MIMKVKKNFINFLFRALISDCQFDDIEKNDKRTKRMLHKKLRFSDNVDDDVGFKLIHVYQSN